MKGNNVKQPEVPKATSAPTLADLGTIRNGDHLIITKTGKNEMVFTKWVSKDTAAVASLMAPLFQKPTTFLDWGGVFGLSKDGTKLKQQDGDYWLFSFTTPKKIGTELSAMVNRFFSAGGTGLIILTQKKGKQGKAALLNALAPLLKHQSLYYEDSVTDVIDQLIPGDIKIHWVQPQAPNETDIQEAAEQGETVEDYSQVYPKDKNVIHLTQQEFLERLFE